MVVAITVANIVAHPTDSTTIALSGAPAPKIADTLMDGVLIVDGKAIISGVATSS